MMLAKIDVVMDERIDGMRVRVVHEAVPVCSI
jgi:hypothetical protein